MRLKLSWMTLLPHTKAIKIWQTNTNNSAEMINASKSRAYRLKAIPTKTGYTLSVWMDSLGNAYKCTDIDSANKFKTAMTNGKGCESVSKKKAS